MGKHTLVRPCTRQGSGTVRKWIIDQAKASGAYSSEQLQEVGHRFDWSTQRPSAEHHDRPAWEQASASSDRAARPPRFPPSWGEPPSIQTADYRLLPGGYGYGSSTLASWILRKMATDTVTSIPRYLWRSMSDARDKLRKSNRPKVEVAA